jgi:hypothetical protein
MQIGFTPAQVQHRIDHQLPWSVMGDLPATIDAMQGRWRMVWLKAQVILRRSPTKGEARRMLKNPHRFSV